MVELFRVNQTLLACDETKFIKSGYNLNMNAASNAHVMRLRYVGAFARVKR